jgi:phage head maturation protease
MSSVRTRLSSSLGMRIFWNTTPRLRSMTEADVDFEAHDMRVLISHRPHTGAGRVFREQLRLSEDRL